MTLNEANELNEQLKELEQIEMEKKHRNHNSTTTDNTEKLKKSPGSQLASSLFGLGTTSNATLLPSTFSSNPNGGFSLNSFAEILSNAGNEFEREWESAFANDASKTSKIDNDTAALSPTSLANTNEFDFFASNDHDPKADIKSTSLFSDLLNRNEELKLDLNLIHNNKPTTASTTSAQTHNKTEVNNKNSAWYDLFAELDPIKNPDTIGKDNDKDERNC